MVINPINLPFRLTYAWPEQDSRGRIYTITLLRNDITKWLEKENIKYNYSDTFSSIWFETEEEKVRFILQWI